jgi:Cadherin domain
MKARKSYLLHFIILVVFLIVLVIPIKINNNSSIDRGLQIYLAFAADPTDISLNPSSVAENQPPGITVGTFTTTDPDPDETFTYSLVAGTGGTDNDSFTIAGDTLNTSESFDYEVKNSYSIRVQTVDNNGGTFQKEFTVNVTNVNEPPTDISLSPSSVAENQPSGTTVGTLSTTDPDAGETFTYTLIAGNGDTDNTSFSISGNTLQTAALFDYETKNSFSILVQSKDSDELPFEKQFNVTVTNINEPPTDITLSGDHTVEEMIEPPVVVGNFSTVDVDGGPDFTYSLVSPPSGCASDDNTSFTISGNSLRTAVAFDFETKPDTKKICVQTNDGKGETFHKSFTISILDKPKGSITVTPITSLTTEAGGQASFSMVLDFRPSANVSISLSSSDTTEGVVLPPTTLTFTTSNWKTPQIVLVKGVDDSIADGLIAYSIITAPAVSTDPDYSGVNPADIPLANADDDSAGISVAPLTGLTTTEGKISRIIQVKLNTQPTAGVVFSFSSTDLSEGTVYPTQLTITPANWVNTYEVQVTGVDDLIVDGDKPYSIKILTTSTDPKYNNLKQTVLAVNRDAPNIEWTSPVKTEQIYYVEDFKPFLLKVVRSSPEEISKVKFYRWDQIQLKIIDIIEILDPPYQFWYDPSLEENKLIEKDYNQVFARAIDSQGDFIDEFILLYVSELRYTLYLPLVLNNYK